MRLQLALNVSNLEQAIAYYTKLFATEPHKVRNGYANFLIHSPPLKLVLFENPEADQRLNHLGVEVDEPAQIASAKARLAKCAILDEVVNNQTCCHARQDKLWSREPQGLRWEWYRISDDAPDKAEQSSACCSQNTISGETRTQ
ncbi:MAG: glyoxalase/bleomycin resistance/dioxygenase family protein [Porticoccaceae bacterium]|nr:glyoxalase/bleomycin resistance/dioxygenase family protein [Porticoccaceae bacterium]